MRLGGHRRKALQLGLCPHAGHSEPATQAPEIRQRGYPGREFGSQPVAAPVDTIDVFDWIEGDPPADLVVFVVRH